MKKENEILECLSGGLGVNAIMKKLGVNWVDVNKVREKHGIEKPPKMTDKPQIWGRLKSPLMKQVLAECERLGICRAEFVEMVVKFYFKDKGC